MSDTQQFPAAMPTTGGVELLDTRPERPDLDGDFGESGGQFSIASETTSKAVYTDEWDDYRGSEIVKAAALGRIAGGLRPGDQGYHELVDRTSGLIASLYHYSPEMVPEPLCSDKHFHKFLSDFMASDDYEKLHRRTKANSAITEIAAAQTVISYYRLLQQQQQQQQQQGGSGGGGEGDDQSKKAAQQAAKQAIKSADEADDLGKQFGIGTEDGTGGQMDPDLLQSLYHEFRNNQHLKSILQATGKYMAVAKSIQRNAFAGEPEEISDVTVSGVVEHLMPSELVMLCNPDTEDIVLKRILEKQALSYHYDSPGDKQAGPVMVFCDESGSMHGTRIVEAKAVALVMAWIAIHQNRWCNLVGFASRNQIHDVILSPREPATERARKTLEWLNHFYEGGTEIDFLAPKAIEKRFQESGAPRGETDILFLTDGDCNYSKDLVEPFKQWKLDNEVRMVSIGIGCHTDPLPEMSDFTCTCRSLTEDVAGVGEAFKAGIRPTDPEDDQAAP